MTTRRTTWLKHLLLLWGDYKWRLRRAARYEREGREAVRYHFAWYPKRMWCRGIYQWVWWKWYWPNCCGYHGDQASVAWFEK